MNEQLSAIGDALERAVALDLEHSRARRQRWRSPRVGVAVVVAAITVPAMAYAATNLLSTSQVAASLPAGTKALIGTDPTCTVVTANVEYHCVLASPPVNPAGLPISRPTVENGRPVVPLNTPVRVTVTEANGKTVVISAPTARALKGDLDALGGTITKVAVAFGANNQATTTAPAMADATPNTTTAPPATDWTGTDEATDDASRHVNGGCRALNAAGTSWECYIGEAAVKQNIISQGFLGQYAPVPGVG